MKILLLTAGTRGDVQPFIALGLGLKRAGHAVTVCTHQRFESTVTERGLSYAFMNDDILKLMDTAGARSVLESGTKVQRALRLMRLTRAAWPGLRRSLDEAWEAAQGADAVVHHPRGLAGYHIAEKLDVPVFLGVHLPVLTPTRRFPNLMVPDLKLGGWYNRLSHRLMPLMAMAFIPMVNRWRRRVLGLPRHPWLQGLGTVRWDGRPVPVLYTFSRHVVAPPDDWPESAHVTGFWFLEGADGYEPPAELLRFIETGDPPIYVGFGSMAGTRPLRLTRIVADALKQTGQRGVIATGWGGLARASHSAGSGGLDALDSVFLIDAVPHDWLFPKVAAVIHHGGVGTTAAGIRAGKPTIICPFFGDQPYWGRRVYELGAGPKPIRQRKLTATKLASAIDQAIHDEGIKRRAAELGEQIRKEDGVAAAVSVINRAVG